MLPKSELACFVIADISGYSSFLTAVEIDHAQDIIADFMDTVVKGVRPPFRLAKFEGDAAFVYAVNEKFGSHAYALYSDTRIQAMNIDPVAQGLVEHHETIDSICRRCNGLRG